MPYCRAGVAGRVVQGDRREGRGCTIRTRLRPAGAKGLFAEHAFVFEEGNNGAQAVATLQVGEGPWAIAAHTLGIARHHLQ